MRHYYLVFALFLFSWQAALAQGTEGYQFLKIGVGARQTALGEAAASLDNGADAVFWNPAGLAELAGTTGSELTQDSLDRSGNEEVAGEVLAPKKKFHLSASYTRWLVDSRHYAASLARPIGGSYVVGMSFAALDIESFRETTVAQPKGTGRMVDAGDVALGIAIAGRLPMSKLVIFWGAQVKYIEETLDNVKFNSTLFDVGILMYYGNLRLAFAHQHFGETGNLFNREFRLPRVLRFGSSTKIYPAPSWRITPTLDFFTRSFDKEHNNLGAGVEIERNLDEKNDKKRSVWRESRTLALRAGYRYQFIHEEGDFSFGIGVTPVKSFNIDYAFTPFGEFLGTIHRFSIRFSF